MLSNFQTIAEKLHFPALMTALEANPEAWKEFTLRQDYAGSAHRDTESIVFCGPRPDGDIFNDIEQTWYRPVDGPLFVPAMQAVGACLRHITDIGDRGRIMLVKLKAGGHITPHVDEGAYADYYDRFHLVLSGHCDFRCGDTFYSPMPGDFFWFNHKKEHEVWNGTEEDRVHLIVDIVAPEYRVLRGS